jgi:DNA-binding response OmpR family regulator
MNAPVVPIPAACPCCGAPVNPLAIMVNAPDGVVSIGGLTAFLTPSEFSVFDLLVRAYPAVATKEQLYDDLYGARPECDWPEVKLLDVMVFKLRRKLDPIGLEIRTVWGRGWTIVPPDTAISAMTALNRESRRRRR